MRKSPTPEKIVKCLQKLKLSHTDDILIHKGDTDIWAYEQNRILITKPSPDEHEDLADRIAEVLSELSLRYMIRYIGEDGGGCWLYIQLLPSEDGTTNITADVIQAIIDKMTPAN